MKLTVRPATVEDAISLSKNLREADRNEIKKLSGSEPIDSLLYGVIFSDEPLAISDSIGTVVGLMGVISETSDVIKSGTIWLLASEDLATKGRRQLVLEAKMYIDRFFERFDMLWNYVDKANDVHIKWLKHCGFTFINEIKIGDASYLEFVKIKEGASN